MEGFAGLYALLLIPGFIWVQVYEYYLLREKKEQFVKTLEIILWSAFIWAFSLWFALICPFKDYIRSSWLHSLFPIESASLILNFLKSTTGKKSTLDTLVGSPSQVLNFVAAVCFWTFIGANLWAMLRRFSWSNTLLMWLTGREWYPTASQKFYAENMGRSVWVVTKEKEYVGTLHSAPDTAGDGHIILKNPSVQAGGLFRLMPLNQFLLLRVADIVEIKSVSPIQRPPDSTP